MNSGAGKDETKDMNDHLSILLVDDGSGDASVSWLLAADGALAGLRITQATCLADALRFPSESPCDVVVLVLEAGGEFPAHVVERLVGAAGATPVVLLTTTPNEEFSERALALGVQDHVVLGEDGVASLSRSLRNAVMRLRHQGAREASPEDSASITSLECWQGKPSMKETLPHVFDDLAGNVADVLLLMSATNPRDGARVLAAHVPTLAARLAMLTATPADVADVVRAASLRHARRMRSGGDPQAEAGRRALLLIALLGALCEHYKRDALDHPCSRGTMFSSTG